MAPRERHVEVCVLATSRAFSWLRSYTCMSPRVLRASPNPFDYLWEYLLSSSQANVRTTATHTVRSFSLLKPYSTLDPASAIFEVAGIYSRATDDEHPCSASSKLFPIPQVANRTQRLFEALLIKVASWAISSSCNMSSVAANDCQWSFDRACSKCTYGQGSGACCHLRAPHWRLRLLHGMRRWSS